MARRTRTTIVVVLVVITAGLALWWFAATRISSRVDAPFARLRTNRWNYEERQKAATELARMGSEAIPSLAAALKDGDSALIQQCDVWRAKLPAQIQAHFPVRVSKDEVRRAVASAIYEIGPEASRGLVGAIEFAIDPGLGLENADLLRALCWSIPESPKAVQILSNYLAHPALGLPLFGMKDADEIWPTIPQLAPLLAKWLTLADSAGEAAGGLSQMGTQAHFAIPQIIELAEKGYVGGLSNATLHVLYTPNLETNILHNNNAAALAALGRMGQATPEVLATIQKQLTNELPFLRASAANALGEFGSNAVPALPMLLAHLDRNDAMVLRYQIEAIGKMGPAAKAAAPVLLRYTDASIASSVAEGERFAFSVRWGWDPLEVQPGAAVAVGQIDPESAKGMTKQISEAFDGLITSNAVIALRPLRGDILPHLERALEKGSALLAYNTLLLDPANTRVEEVLLSSMKPEHTMNLRSSAARWHFHIFHQTNLALAVFRETLKEVRGLDTQGPITLARELGPAGRPLAPLIKPILTNEHRIMRNLAGKTMRTIAPEEMPPVGEE